MSTASGVTGPGASFGARLAEALRRRGGMCVGIDPHPELLQAWGLPPTVDGLERFALGAVDALAGEVAVLKPQSAFFEAYGAAGIAVLERVLVRCREAGAVSLLDVKRGDVGSTMSAYAQAYLAEQAPLRADAITLSPYLGVDALLPAFRVARQHGAGAFVLARTSNPEGEAPQLARMPATESREPVGLAQWVVDELTGHQHRGHRVGGRAHDASEHAAMGDLGIVVGATLRCTGLRLEDFCGPVLAPGIGAQGGGLDRLPGLFGPVLPMVIPAVARAVLAEGPYPSTLRAAHDALRERWVGIRG